MRNIGSDANDLSFRPAGSDETQQPLEWIDNWP
jgi:hypothetical protein